ncbi:MAG: hypothetical protein KDC34_11955 [Saprospiraceae bacterium]|nr:hypothetical protein [Saprospiraceae bacterium]
MPKKKPKKGNPEVHKDLSGFDIRIDAFGEIKSNVEIDKLNRFLDDKIEDKKLIGRSTDSSEEE